MLVDGESDGWREWVMGNYFLVLVVDCYDRVWLGLLGI